MISYTYNKTAFTKTKTFILQDNVIKVLDESKHLIDTVKIDAITSISLVHTPIKTARKMHQCTIKTIDGRKIILRNYSFVGFANFKKQTDNYLKFILDLHEQTKNKPIQFKKGINKIGFVLLTSFMILMTVLMAVIVYMLFNKEKYGEMTISGIAFLLFVFLTITSIARFKPEKYNPNNIPKHLLPN